MITRRKDYTKKDPLKDASKIYIISEGTDSEIKYFNFFVGLSSNLELIVIPSVNGTDPLKLMELAKDKFLGQNRICSLECREKDQVWFVIDTDTWEQEGKITPLREFCAAQNSDILKTYDEIKAYNAWNVAQSNPCFEVWLYYHHYDSLPEIESVPYGCSIKKYVDSLIADGFDYECDPSRIQFAIERAENVCRYNDDHKLEWFATELFKLARKSKSILAVR
ncbi:RloB domain-containing protein [Palleniella muris]|uniref:RloB domain-containing protein n=1 Tax=Palleniella muris TaxID=3038145 RepID=A0AC61QNX5_9BACT|nr:RloB family protein [Palleniella muris]TGX81397.1 RloB domain-containing protein [Palleniella muris]